MNKFFGKGRISQDLDVKTSQNDKKIVRFSIAIRNDFKSQSGEYESHFFNCVAFGNQAEFLSKYFKKGQEILISGHLQNNNWQTESGEKRTSTNIVVETAEFCGAKNTTQETTQETTVDTDLELPF